MSRPHAAKTPPPATAARLRGVAGSAVRDILALTERPGVISFAGGLPEPGLFDTAGLRDAFTRALSDDAGRRSLQYSTTEGDPVLRERIAELLTARGLPTAADDVLVTSGSQQALTLVATLLLEPGSAVLVEEPAYLAALQAFQLAGARLVPVACDDDGLIPEALEAAVLRDKPVLLYTVPTFQNPTGRTLPDGAARDVARIAAEHGLWILEDDPYGELRYDGEPVAPIAALPDVADRVLALSTLSKIVAPGLRIGWVRAPDERASGRWSSPSRPPTCTRRPSIRSPVASGSGRRDLPRHMEHLRGVYRERRDALVGGLAEALPAGQHVERARRWHVRLGSAAGWVGCLGAADLRVGAGRRVRPWSAVLLRDA